MEFKFNGKISLEDYVAFNKFQAKFKGWQKIVLFICFIIILSMILINLYFGINRMLDFYEKMSAISDGLIIKLTIIQIFKEFKFIFVMLLLFLFYIIYYYLYYRKVKKNYNSNKLFNEEQYYTVTENQIEIKNAFSNGIITKDKINRIVYYKNSVYIFISLSDACLITESFFADSNEFMNFKSFMKNNYNIVKN